MSEALAAARAWLRQDPDPETRDELAALVTGAAAGRAEAIAEVEERFGGRLAFGTAGLRGALGAGPTRMNRVLVIQATAGFAAYLRARTHTPTVVVGYDGRKNSKVFALDAAEIFAGAGLRTILLPRLLPTPLLAFAVRHLGADAGVMVTASHNPREDNGYKVYLGGADEGSQIVSPADIEIAAAIEAVAAGDIGALARSGDYEIAEEGVVRAYVEATASLATASESTEGMNWVYTPMHGVGYETFAAVLECAGYPAPHIVAEQQHPDPTFGTVAFPNPEEPGSMDLAFALARTVDAEFIVAHDPDADRLAIAIPDAGAEDGWRRLTGNEVGLLLGARAAVNAEGRAGASVSCSLVSSPGLRVVAERHGLGYTETLTGFKWVSRVPGLVYGFEEALGYLVNPETVRDKDGISASMAMLDLIAQARARGATISDLLAEFGANYGYFASGQVSVRVSDLAVIAQTMASLRSAPLTRIGETEVTLAEDLLREGGELPPGNVLRYHLEDGSRVIVRPSGTEPKLKVYLDTQAASAEDAAAALARVEVAVRLLLDEHGRK